MLNLPLWAEISLVVSQPYCEMFPCGMACKVSFAHVQQPHLHFQSLSCTQQPSYLEKVNQLALVKTSDLLYLLGMSHLFSLTLHNCINLNDVYYR